eukprot:g26201.t1
MLLQERQANFTMNRSGELQGFLIWVEVLPFGDEHECLSSLKDVDISWSAMLLALPETLTVVKGDRFPCKTNVQPDTVDGPLLHLEMPWTNKQMLQFQWSLKAGAKWILPEGQEILFANQPEDILSPEQEFLWELLGPPCRKDLCLHCTVNLSANAIHPINARESRQKVLLADFVGML